MSLPDLAEATLLGATPGPPGTRFLVWAPQSARVEVCYEHAGEISRVFLLAGRGGYHFGTDPQGQAGDVYKYRLDGKKRLPDPASRAQLDGVAGPSTVVDPHRYRWRHPEWTRPSSRSRVLYELHVGTFTAPGTFVAAAERLEYIAALGVNTIEVMPVHQFPGRWSWGYDGVLLFAPAQVYGSPDDLRSFVDAAHGHGLAVVLDVVYNHLGPTGNVLPEYSADYFHRESTTTWGTALNFDGPGSAEVRRFFLENAAHWLDEYRIDGLRLDATHALQDTSPRHILQELAEMAHARGAFVMAEDERNDALLIRDSGRGGYGIDGVWADDFHHSLKVATTGISEGYFRAFDGSTEELVRILNQGWLYTGQVSPPTGKPRGTPADGLAPERFIHCLSNHDQVGNRALGERLNHEISGPLYRAVSMLVCLTPYTPLLFMGQEWSASAPFLYFSDHPGELGQKMAEYRRAEFRQHGINLAAHALERMPDPQAETTFLASKLPWTELTDPGHAGTLALYRRCLQLRAAHAVFQNPPRDRWSVARLGRRALALRWHDPAGDWLLLIFLEGDAEINPAAPAVVHPRAGHRWQLVLDSVEENTPPPTVLSPGPTPSARLYQETAHSL